MAGYRKPSPLNGALAQLIEQRDDLKIQIHLAAEKKRLDEATLKELRAELSDLERKIDACWRASTRN